MTTPHYNKLMDSLERQTKLARSFVYLLDQEQAALQVMGMAQLMKISKQKESGIRQITYLDEQIQETMQDMLPETRETAIKLSDFASTLPAPEASELDEVRTILANLRKQIDEKNYVNYNFTNDTLQYINDAIGLISDNVGTEPIYSARGLGKAVNRSPALISRAV